MDGVIDRSMDDRATLRTLVDGFIALVDFRFDHRHPTKVPPFPILRFFRRHLLLLGSLDVLR